MRVQVEFGALLTLSLHSGEGLPSSSVHATRSTSVAAPSATMSCRKRKIPAFSGNQTPVINPTAYHFTDGVHPADKPRPVISIKYLYEVGLWARGLRSNENKTTSEP